MKSEILDKFAALITFAFGLVAALAWNGAIIAIFTKYFGTAENITAMVIYAVIVTLIAILVTILIARSVKKAKGAAPSTKECTYCLTDIPIKATRCPHCTSELAK
jgi:hydrogenase-4 membrane subunit HyfE